MRPATRLLLAFTMAAWDDCAATVTLSSPKSRRRSSRC